MNKSPLLFLFCLFFWACSVHAETMNGFNVNDGLIPTNEIHSGGPPRDGIPALTNPKFKKASRAKYLHPNDIVIGIIMNGKAKAYPIRILNWHEIVNDSIGSQNFVVTYCPLCGTGMVFDSVINRQNLKFGVSGLLYQSDVLLYDKQTESLWSQIRMQAVTGKMKGTRLKLLPATHTTWKDWQSSHPNTLVLSDDTGYPREYRNNPYAGYESTNRIFFPVKNLDHTYPPKEWTVAIQVGDKTKLYPFSELIKNNKSQKITIKDKISDHSFRLEINPATREVHVFDDQGNDQSFFSGFWFALRTFYPKAEVYSIRK